MIFIYSDNFISKKGLLTNYNFLIKHDNSFASTPVMMISFQIYINRFDENRISLVEKNEKYNNYLKPIIAVKKSPNNSKDISNKDLRISYDNIFLLIELDQAETLKKEEQYQWVLNIKRR